MSLPVATSRHTFADTSATTPRPHHIKPAPLSRQILALTGQLETLALAKKPATVKPPVNRAWNA
ncbi:hypothetical protein FB472_2812 [Rhodoglobus vestalii]|uniref:Uncharacterized protein n=1 Tax=Rhodoglobus vestalii TaxID=193384 RepID=A0A8H2PV07_9MICO|nr:hypothetical protein FB472_2812 [Rhodoglobus vestalii]